MESYLNTQQLGNGKLSSYIFTLEQYAVIKNYLQSIFNGIRKN